MRVLIIGGTGLISRGIVKQLLRRGADVTVFNRAKRPDTLPKDVRRLVGDRADVPGMTQVARAGRYDVVIDMICFKPEQAAASIEAFGGHCTQFILCSTVCTYGIKYSH